MSRLDLINACFELVACALCWASVWRLRRDRCVLGIFWPQVAWSGVWGLWCLPYYLGVGHFASFGVASVREAGTLAWVALYIYFQLHPQTIDIEALAGGRLIWRDEDPLVERWLNEEKS